MKKSKIPLMVALNSIFENQRNAIRIRKAKTNAEKERLMKKAAKKRYEKRGIRKFIYGDNTILARNQENADRKARNKGFL